MSLVGQVFSNRYLIERELAQGGMAEVYVARDQLLDRPVALKALFPEYAREPSFVERFRREAQAAANLNNPNIVAIYDWGNEAGTYFIVMEYVEGQSLRDLIRSEGPLDPMRAADIGAEIATALATAHRGGVVHRDVKPGNVIITQSGSVKVTDFGIARAGTADGLTQTGSVMGTATYFSPEQAQGLPVDGRSDVYSLGVVLYEMATGVVPFTGDSPVAVAYKHVREEPVRPTERNAAIPTDLEQIILTAMAKDPDLRYQTADDLRSDLLRFRRGRPLAAGPVTALVAEMPTTAVAAAAGTGAVTAAATLANPVAVDERGRQVVGPEYKKRRWNPWLVTLLTLLGLTAIVLAILALSSAFGSDEEKVAVPNVVGKTLSQATTELNNAHLSPEIEQVPNETVKTNVVFEQDPKSGDKVKKSTTVHLKVSSGIGPVKIPDVTNQPVDAARKTLTDNHLDVIVGDPAPSSTIAKGNVVSTDPPAGTTVAAGSNITIVPSAGIPVPNVLNLPQDQAAQTLQDAGFNVQTFTEQSDTVAEGLVTRTDPPPNTASTRGATVKMFVSTGSNKVTVPEVRGQTLVNAGQTLTAQGLKWTMVETVSTPGNAGKVLDQNPTAGTRVAPGTTVVLTIGIAPQTTTSAAPTTTTTAP
jgi:eukaryotic-like serine/threonine-protein kinase